MNNVVKYDREQYERHLARIESLEADYAKIKQELATADRRIEDGWLMGTEARYLTQQATQILKELTELRGLNIEIVEAPIYRLSIKYPNGGSAEGLFKLVQQEPGECKIPGVREISVKSPLGACINNKEVGSEVQYRVTGIPTPGTVKILEEVKFQTSEQDEM